MQRFPGNENEVDVAKAHQIETARRFLARHHAPPVLLLPNVWDAMSATLFAAAGLKRLQLPAAASLGPWDIPMVRKRLGTIVAAYCPDRTIAQVPVTADIETGYGATPAEVGAHVAEIIQTGVVGINLEDGLHGPIA